MNIFVSELANLQCCQFNSAVRWQWYYCIKPVVYTCAHRAGFKRGQTGQLPRASTTKGPPQKNIKKIIT